MATTKTQSLTKKYEDVRDWFSQEPVQKQLKTIVPKHLNPSKLLATALQLIRSTPELADCDKGSLILSIMTGLNLGLSFDRALGQAYLVPFRNTKANRTEAQFIPGYRGYLTLARNTGELSYVSAQAVYTNDKFDLQYGTDEHLIHVPAEGDRGAFKGAFVVFFYRDGSKSFDYMDKGRLDKIKNISKAKASGPWVDWAEEMSVKTVIRHHIKVVPLATEMMARAAALEDRFLAGESQSDLLSEQDIAIPEPQTSDESIDSKKEEEFNKYRDKSFETDMAGLGLNKEESYMMLGEFVALVAKQNDKSISEVMGEAVSKWPDFWAGFQKYTKSKTPKQEGKKEPERPISTQEKESLPPPLPLDAKKKPSVVKKGMIYCPEAGVDIEEKNCEEIKCKHIKTCPERG